MTAPYIPERDHALLAALKREINTRLILDFDEIYAHIATQVAAPRFYISEDRAIRIIRHHLLSNRWISARPLKQKMYRDIERIALRILERHEADNLTDAIYIAVNGPAPSFYLSPKSVRTYIYNARANKYSL